VATTTSWRPYHRIGRTIPSEASKQAAWGVIHIT
jgi:hypothetical protein